MSINNFNTALNISCLAYRKNNSKVKGGIYATPVEKTGQQKNTIQKALNELSEVKFSFFDKLYMKTLGVNLPFKNGAEAVKFLTSKNAEISYADFSKEDVHACLDTTKNTPTVLINSSYKDFASKADVLAISEAMLHEAAHAKDCDSLNSIQEELDCLALNVLAHQHYKRKYPGVFEGQKSALFSEGVSLYSKLFFETDLSKKALKERICDKYGYLDLSSPYHKPSRLAREIKKMSENA